MAVPGKRTVLVVGGGPAGLMAAERLARAGCAVTLTEQMPTVGRKFLMAGRGGLNLTHSEPLERFVQRYTGRADILAPMITRFTPEDLRAWCQGLGEETFVGSSGRVFPQAFKASPLLRAWLARLRGLDVTIRTRTSWQGWDGEGRALLHSTTGEKEVLSPDATVLALGGASWPRLGSDGRWVGALEGAGVPVAPFRPANCGILIPWTEVFRSRFEGQPVKNVALRVEDGTQRGRGDVVVTRHGLEGGPVYALSADLRQALDRSGTAVLEIDLSPDRSAEQIAGRLARVPARRSRSNALRKAVRLDPVAIGLCRESCGKALPDDPQAMAALIKRCVLTVRGLAGLERAISSAGGVAFDGLDEHLMLLARPGVFVAGEMLDWEAPTGGYLLQACFASAVAAADGVCLWLGIDPSSANEKGLP